MQHFTSLSHYLFYHFERGIKDWCLIPDEKRAKKCQTFLQHPNVRKFILRFKEQLAHNPFLQVAIFIALASLLAPIFLFIIFGIVSAVFVFIGFMIIQGKQSYFLFLIIKLLLLDIKEAHIVFRDSIGYWREYFKLCTFLHHKYYYNGRIICFLYLLHIILYEPCV